MRGGELNVKQGRNGGVKCEGPFLLDDLLTDSLTPLLLNAIKKNQFLIA